MKKNLLICLLLFSISISAQKLKAIGVDLGGNIIPLLTKYQGFTGGLIVQASTKKDVVVEYKIGYASFERSNNKIKNNGFGEGYFTQKNNGYYGSIGRNANKKFGWHGTFAVFRQSTTWFLKDFDFDTSYQHVFPTAFIFSLGGDIYYGFPIKITNKVSTSIRLSVSSSLNISSKSAHQALYSPGFNPIVKSFFPPNLGFGLSVPFFVNLE